MSAAISLSGIGLCSSMGGFKNACAAFRAGLNRFAAHDDMKVMVPGEEEPTPITTSPAATNLSVYSGSARIVKLLERAYIDLIENMQSTLPTEDLLILVAIPDPEQRGQDVDEDEEREKRLQAYLETIVDPLFELTDTALKTAPIQCVFGDRVAFARILQKANDYLKAGKAKHCLLLTADSLLDTTALESQLQKQQLKTDDNPVGYIPSEGGAMLLLSQAAVARRGSPAFRCLVEVDNSTCDLGEPESVQALWHGDKLFQRIKQSFGSLEGVQVMPQQVCDLNGEEKRAQEFGNIVVKLKSEYPACQLLDPQIPALGFGETGAMSAPIALSVISAAVGRQYAKHRDFFITLSEDTGKRAVIRCQFLQ